MTEITYRPYDPADMDAVFHVYLLSVNALLISKGKDPIADMTDESAIAREWRNHHSIMEHIEATTDRALVAEKDGEIVGYARSIIRDNIRQLTEFFIKPDSQSSGIGRELITKVFPADAAFNRTIVSTDDPRALARYLKAGVVPQFPMCYFLLPKPKAYEFESDLAVEPLKGTPQHLAELNVLDREILGYERASDHVWWIDDQDRTGYAFRRDGRLVAYAYVGMRTGPMAVEDALDFPAVLAFGENHAVEHNHNFHVPLPLINRMATQHMLDRGARMETDFMNFFMTDQPFGKFENYVFNSPDFIF